MSAARVVTSELMSPEQLAVCEELIDQAPADGQGFVLVRQQMLEDLFHDACVARSLHDLVNTPELVDFARGVHLEAAHQEQRWGTPDRRSKGPYEWFWLLSHLATRALEHHKEAERLQAEAPHSALHRAGAMPNIAHHREKAAHHTITAAAVLAHWHACVIGKHTAMQPGHSGSAAEAAELLGEG